MNGRDLRIFAGLSAIIIATDAAAQDPSRGVVTRTKSVR